MPICFIRAKSVVGLTPGSSAAPPARITLLTRAAPNTRGTQKQVPIRIYPMDPKQLAGELPGTRLPPKQ